MSKRAKGITFIGLLIVLSMMVVITIVWVQISKARTVVVNPNRYYTWGLKGDALNIEPGEIITEVTFTLLGVTHQTDDPIAQLEIFLVDAPPAGSKGETQKWISNMGDIIGHDASHSPSPPRKIISGRTMTTEIRKEWEPQVLLNYQDTHIGKEDVVFKLSEINDPESWVWNIFDSPFNFTLASVDPNNAPVVSFSSGLLEFIDYAGNSTPVGILVDPNGGRNFRIDGIKMKIKVESFNGDYIMKEQTIVVEAGDYRANKAPVLL